MGNQTRYRLTRDASRRLDAAATERYGIPSILLMENAAFGLCAHALEMQTSGDWTLIACGPGNNGGDGHALARHLANAGVDVLVVQLGLPGGNASDARTNLDIIRRMDVPVVSANAIDSELQARGRPGLIVDALFGTGLTRAIEGQPASIVAWINDSGTDVLSVDAPSGLDADAGRPLGPTVRATRTVTFVAMKAGFDALEAQPWLGEVHVVGIGAPSSLLEEFGTGSDTDHPGQHRVPGADPGPRGRLV